jgi:Fuc2NAc and GlcNAc transferase
MMLLNYSIIFFCISFALTFLAKLVLVHFQIIDKPSSRSMHNHEIVRGGGIAIVATVIFAFSFLEFRDSAINYHYITLIIYTAIFATLGFADDIFSISYKPRLFIQFGAVILLLSVPGFHEIQLNFGLFIIDGGIAKLLLCIFSVWFINLYNFMDGINGIAAAQAIIFCFSLGFLIAIHEYPYPFSDFIFLGSICLGFLLWNFPRAQIFLGDVGSNFLGAIFSFYLIYFSLLDSKLFWAAIILMGLFIVDATFTLLSRLIHKKSFHSAHNSHAYQNLSRRFNSHTLATTIFMGINITYLLPMSHFMLTSNFTPLAFVILSYLPLIAGCMVLRAGK